MSYFFHFCFSFDLIWREHWCVANEYSLPILFDRNWSLWCTEFKKKSCIFNKLQIKNRKYLKYLTCLFVYLLFCSGFMGSLGVWAVAVAALLGTSGCWLAEGHKSNKRGSMDRASHVSSHELHPGVNMLINPSSENWYQSIFDTLSFCEF